MKKAISLFILIAIGAFISVQLFNAQGRSKDDFNKTFIVQTEKSDYLMLEPIWVKFKYKISSTQSTPQVLQDSLVKVTFKGKTKEFSGLSHNIVSGRPQRLPDKNTSVQFEYYEKEGIIDRVKEFFPETGNYQLQFCLNGEESNVVSINIEEPLGIDKEASDFLKKRIGDISFYWVWEKKNGLELLKEFTDKYGQSIYGEYGVRYLGNIYLTKGEFDKAEVEFEKVRNSGNKYIADNANQSLAEIREKKAGLEKMKKP